MEEKKKELHELFANTKVMQVEATDELKKSFISYAMAVNVSRAIPDVRDGLKPVHRRILYSMGELGNFSDKPYKKCARIVGEVMGKYHPHGDSSVYDALVRLAQDFSIRYPLVDGHGNFGSIDGDSPAAMRYTEARLSKISEYMLEDIDKETVDMYPNFDDTLMQPRVLPCKFPNLLVNGADGIAVGMATNIPPHNLTEVINGVEALIDNPDITVDELMNYIPAPDFPTGGIIMGRNAIRQAYTTGRGSIIVRGKAEIEETENGRFRIVISELPYGVNKARFIMQMADLVKDKKIEGISDIKEESDRDGLRVVVDIKKDANAQVVLNMLYKKTMLQQSEGIIMLALVNREPKVLNLKEVLYYYLEHQKDVLIRKTKFDLKKAEERMHIVQGLVIALAHIDEVIKIIKEADDKDDAKTKLIQNFELDDIQANAILEMKLSKLTSLEVEKLNEEYKELENLIEELNSILESEAKVLSIIKNNLEDIKNKFGDKRRTEISHDLGDINIADLIKKEDVVISKTHQGYIKRMSLDEYRTQKRGGVGISAHRTKEEDFVEDIFVANTHDDLLFFTNFGKVYTLKTYEIPEAQRQAKGRAMINLLPLESGEKVNTIISLTEDTTNNLVMATKQGLIKKTKLIEFANIRKNGKIAISLNEGDELIGIMTSTGDDEILIASSDGKCARFNEQKVRTMGRTAQGVKSINLADGECVVAITVIKKGENDAEIITVSEKGYGKRNHVDDFRLTSRGAKGVKAGIFNEKTGKLAVLKQVGIDQDVIIVADNGVIIRTPVKDISLIGRNSQGVKIMKLREGAKVVSMAVNEHEEEHQESVDEVIEENIENAERNNENLDNNTQE